MKLKQCARCQKKKPLEDFYKNKSTKDGLQKNCKPCCNIYSKQHYEKNKQVYIDKAAYWNSKKRAVLQEKMCEYLREHPCVDCGEDDIVVLQFDHISDDKEHNISEMIRRYFSWEEILIEIQKCEVVCANDHARRTGKRANWYKCNTPT